MRIFIKSFFMCQRSKSIVEHRCSHETDCTDVKVLKSWIPALAEKDGLDGLDFIGGYVASVETGIPVHPIAVSRALDTVEAANWYFEEDCSDFKTPGRLDLSTVLSVCRSDQPMASI